MRFELCVAFKRCSKSDDGAHEFLRIHWIIGESNAIGLVACGLGKFGKKQLNLKQCKIFFLIVHLNVRSGY